MSKTLTGEFETRRQADLAVERLVQEVGIERTDIFVSPAGAENSSGSALDGSDNRTLGEAARDDAPLTGAIVVSVDVQDDEDVDLVVAAIEDMEGAVTGD